MTTITCPGCGTENPSEATDCKQCRINLKFALAYPEEIESIKQREQGLPETLQSADGDSHASRATGSLLATQPLLRRIMVIGTIACVLMGLIAIISKSEGWIIFGLIALGFAVAAAVLTRLWTRIDSLPPEQKLIAWIPVIIGGVIVGIGGVIVGIVYLVFWLLLWQAPNPPGLTDFLVWISGRKENRQK